MSEPLPGIPSAPWPAALRDASAVVLFRRVSKGVEVFWLKREKKLAFAGGFYAFAGGKVDPQDSQVPMDEGPPDPLKAAAARELFEETGVLVASGGKLPSPEELASDRRRLLDGEHGFKELLEQRGLRVNAKAFLEAGRWRTPDFMSVRFDARFYLVELPEGATAEVWPGELSEGSWIAPNEALARWQAGTALLHPPNLHAMRTMAAFSSIAEAAEGLRSPPYCEDYTAHLIEFQQGVRIFPVRTPTLPPATHTNCFVLGNGELLLVDPGANEPAEQERLAAFVEALESDGFSPTAVVLTHHHGDHVGGASFIRARFGIPLWCHELTARHLGGADRLLVDGEALELAGTPRMRWRVLHTPGHARGHICLRDESSLAAVVGDMVAGLGTIVIDPPEGDMADYLAQLERLRAFPVGTLFPSHGPIVVDGPAKLAEYLEHRDMREKKVLAALTPGGATVEAILERAYDDVAPFMHPVAERSTQAILLKLEREGRARQVGEQAWASCD